MYLVTFDVADVSEVACRRCHESCIFQRCVWGLGGTQHTATRRIVGLTLYRNFYYSFTTFQFAGQPTARETRLVTSHPDQIWPDH